MPCYNSAAYMSNCIESLLPGGDDIEIIIVNDGSKDDTARIADEYQAKYPGIIKAVHQENGGHGEAVNTGLKHAKGLYFKVVDSDDRLNVDAYLKMLEKLKEIVADGKGLDMMIGNYVYDKEGAAKKRVVRYRTALPQNRIFGWSDVKHFMKGQYLLMHAVIYRTKLLKECGIHLPAHTFYVDNIFVFEPLPYVKTMYYMNVNLYMYYIGREDQSVNEKVMMGRIDQQIKVTKIMIDFLANRNLPNRKLRHYMRNYLDIILTVSSILLIKMGTEEALAKKRDMWQYLRDKDRRLYFVLRHGIFGSQMNLPGKAGRKVSVAEYTIAQKFMGFN